MGGSSAEFQKQQDAKLEDAEHDSAYARYGAIKRALADGNDELADAIDQERRCFDCGGYVSDDRVSVDPDKCCFFCQP